LYYENIKTRGGDVKLINVTDLIILKIDNDNSTQVNKIVKIQPILGKKIGVSIKEWTQGT